MRVGKKSGRDSRRSANIVDSLNTVKWQLVQKLRIGNLHAAATEGEKDDAAACSTALAPATSRRSSRRLQMKLRLCVRPLSWHSFTVSSFTIKMPYANARLTFVSLGSSFDIILLVTLRHFTSFLSVSLFSPVVQTLQVCRQWNVAIFGGHSVPEIQVARAGAGRTVPRLKALNPFGSPKPPLTYTVGSYAAVCTREVSTPGTLDLGFAHASQVRDSKTLNLTSCDRGCVSSQSQRISLGQGLLGTA